MSFRRFWIKESYVVQICFRQKGGHIYFYRGTRRTHPFLNKKPSLAQYFLCFLR